MNKDELLERLRIRGTEVTLTEELVKLDKEQTSRFLAKVIDFLEGNRCIKRGHILEALLRAGDEPVTKSGSDEKEFIF